MDIVWEGAGVDEVGKDAATGSVRIRVNPKFYRPTEVDTLLGDSSKARSRLGWEPSYDLQVQRVSMRMRSDLQIKPALYVGFGRFIRMCVLVFVPYTFSKALVTDMMDADISLMKANPQA